MIPPEGIVEMQYKFKQISKPGVAKRKGIPARGQLCINLKLMVNNDIPYSILNFYGK